MTILGKIESILFVASKPLTIKKLAKALEVGEDKIEEALDVLKSKYNQSQSGIHLLFDGDMVQMATNPENVEAIDGFVKDEVAGELTKAQLETLTVVAYRGPVSRAEIEQIRGVNCAVILRNLMIRGLIDEQDGKLMPEYVLTVEALRHLGITSVHELPDYETLSQHEYIEQTLDQQSAEKE